MQRIDGDGHWQNTSWVQGSMHGEV